MIPSIETCFQFMDRYGMLENIKDHSVVVAGAARLITRNLCGAGGPFSLKKVTAAALMHDIGKTFSLDSGEDHAELGRRICLQNDLVEIADIVGEHVLLKDYRPNGPLSEKEIVYYADKRVNHDRIVSLDERRAYILRRYGQDREDLCRGIRENFRICKEVEHRLFDRLDFFPESLSILAEEEEISHLGSLRLSLSRA